MNIRQLEIFCAVMRARTTVAAAFELGISQPAVSNAIKHLEDNLGFSLFDRVGNRLVPTAEGKAVYQDVQPLQTMAEGLLQRLSDLRDTKRGHLRVLATRPLGDVFLPRVIKQFVKGRDDVHVYYDVQHLDGVIEAVESGFAELGVALEPPPRPTLDIKDLAKGRMVCLPQITRWRNELRCDPRISRGCGSYRLNRSAVWALQWRRRFTTALFPMRRTSRSCKAWWPALSLAADLVSPSLTNFPRCNGRIASLSPYHSSPQSSLQRRSSALQTGRFRVLPVALSRSPRRQRKNFRMPALSAVRPI